jgi:uncharacterized protein
MDRNDRQAIEHLFDKLAAVESRSPQRDAASEALIGERIARQPGAPYYMAQTIVVQDQALAAAEARIAALEGPNGQEKRRSGSVPMIGRGGSAPEAQQSAGGFLAGAAQTALGVAGGFLLGNAIAGMFGGRDEAQASETNPQTEEPRTEEPQTEAGGDDDPGFDAGGIDAGGFDAGDFGDF